MPPEHRQAAPARVPGVSLYSEALAEEILARVAAGESVQAICADPRFPWPSTVWSWTRAQPEFGVRLDAARRIARTARRMERLRIRLGQAERRRTDRARPAAFDPQQADTICERLVEGESLISICRDPAMPSRSTVFRWLDQRPEFEDAYIRARKLQADYFFEMAGEVAMAATPKTVWADRLRYDAVRWQAARLAPRRYMERLVVAEALAQAQAEAPPVRHVIAVSFRRGPNDEVLVEPPRTPREAELWERAMGRPYDGPGLIPGTTGPGPWDLLEGDYYGAVVTYQTPR